MPPAAMRWLAFAALACGCDGAAPGSDGDGGGPSAEGPRGSDAGPPADGPPAGDAEVDAPPDGSTAPPWKIVAIVVRGTEVGSFATTMSAEEEEAVVAAFETVDDLIATWSGGAGAATLAVEYVDDPPLQSISGGWIYPSDVAEILDAHAPDGAYDSIIVLWDADDDGGASAPGVSCSWCSIASWPVEGANGATYAALDVGEPWMWAAGGEAIVHEWIHGSAAYYREGLDLPVPDPHDNALYGFPEPDADGSWAAWYSALLSGALANPETGSPVGFLPCVWASGTPTDPRPIECEGVAVCGDGACDAGEGCVTCPADCCAGACDFYCADYGLLPGQCDGSCQFVCDAGGCLLYDPMACASAGCG